MPYITNLPTEELTVVMKPAEGAQCMNLHAGVRKMAGSGEVKVLKY